MCPVIGETLRGNRIGATRPRTSERDACVAPIRVAPWTFSNVSPFDPLNLGGMGLHRVAPSCSAWWTFWIFFIFSCSGEGKREPEAPGGGRDGFFIENPHEPNLHSFPFSASFLSLFAAKGSTEPPQWSIMWPTFASDGSPQACLDTFSWFSKSGLCFCLRVLGVVLPHHPGDTFRAIFVNFSQG